MKPKPGKWYKLFQKKIDQLHNKTEYITIGHIIIGQHTGQKLKDKAPRRTFYTFHLPFETEGENIKDFLEEEIITEIPPVPSYKWLYNYWLKKEKNR